MRYIPSPIFPQFRHIYSATANTSGRMQYHRITPGHSKLRITRADFIKAYNSMNILAINPVRTAVTAVPGSEFQIQFYV